jgi:SNF2 family DNA or RNA helicase
VILLLIDEKSSAKQGRLVCSTYIGELTRTQKGYVSGKYKKTSDKELTDFIKKHEESCIYRIGNNTVTFDISNAKNSWNHFMILGYENNHKIVIVDNCQNLTIKRVSLEKNRLFVIADSEVIRIEEKHKIIPFVNDTCIIVKNNMYLIDASIDIKVLKQVVFSKRPKAEISLMELFNNIRKEDRNKICENVDIEVLLREKNNSLIAEPKMLYDGKPVKILSDKTVLHNGTEYYRDYNSELKIQKLFKQFEMISTNTYLIPNNESYIAVRKMIELGFIVFLNDKQVEVRDDKFRNIHFESGERWFSIDGSIKFDDESIQLSELIGDNGIFAEGTKKALLVPENITDLLAIVSDDGKIQKTAENFAKIVEDVSENEFDKNNLSDIFSGDVHLSIPANIETVLFDYQKDGVVWMKKLALNHMGGCLADDMGLGKTVQILTLLADEEIKSQFKKTLIIVPKTILGNWVNEYEKYFQRSYSLMLYYGDNRSLNNEYDVCITTYGILLSDFKELGSFGFELVILDEAQKVKNIDSKTRRIVKKMSLGRTTFAATGTPYENNVLELWSIMDITTPGLLGKYNTFLDNYINGKTEMAQLGRKLSPFLLRRTKEQVLGKLPSKKTENIYCIMDSEQEKLYKAMLIKIKKDLSLKGELENQKLQMLNGLTFLREICCHPCLINDTNYKKCEESIKLDTVLDLINVTNESGEKIVIFSQFTRFLALIENRLEEDGIDYCYIDGHTNKRQKEIDAFSNESKKVFLISLKAGGFGLNLTEARRVIICDPWWNPAVERQAEDRIYRIGQKKDVIVYRLIVKNSVEEKIENLKNRKDEMGKAIFANINDIGDLSPEELLNLL